MMKKKLLFLLYLISLTLFNRGNAQCCFPLFNIQDTDLFGLEITDQLDNLESASCMLKDVFSNEGLSDFKVYIGGGYTINNYSTETPDQLLNKVASSISHPNYLLLIHVKDESGNLSFYAKLGINYCLLYTSPSPRDATLSRMPSSA